MGQKISVFLLAFLATSAAFAQTFRGGIGGVVNDSSGATIAGATVKLSGTDTGLSRDTTSSSSGDFSFPDLPLGKYSVSVSQSGFQTYQVTDISVEAGRVFNVKATLSVSTQATTIEVAAAPVAIETSSSALTSVIPTKAILDTPLNGRDFTQLLKLNPGVNAAGSVNGTRTNSINWQIDGADNNDLWQNSAAVNQGGVAGIAGTVLPIDAIDEFSLQSNSNAENGRNGGGTLNLVIKSGTNDFHGSLYYFNRNEYLAARNWFTDPTTPTQKLRNNQEGGSLGGPIWKNHTFFFLTYEQQNYLAGNTAQGTAPSAAWVAQGENVLARNGVPVSPVSLRLINALWPANSLTGPASENNFFSTANSTSDSYNGIVKLDHIFNEKNNIALRYFGGTGAQTAYIGSVIPYYYQVAPSRMHNFSLVYNRVISAKFVAQTMAGVNYFKQQFTDANSGANVVALGLNTGVTNPSLFGAPDISISGFDETGLTPPLGRIDTTGHLNQTFTVTTGAHQFRFGGEYRRSRLDVYYERNARGVFTFDGSQGPLGGSDPWGIGGAENAGTLGALADFLAGRVDTNRASITYGGLQRNYYINETSGFFQDAWKLRSNLTVNYGLNWIFQSPLSEPTNRISTFIPELGGITYVGQGITTLYPRDWNNFGPRFGFAYNPTSKLVVRGGYGLFYQVPNVNYFGDNRPGNGGATGVLANPGGLSPVYTLSNSLAPLQIVDGAPIFGSSTIPTGPFGAFSVDQHFATGYVHNANMNIQYQLTNASVLEVGYTGTFSRKLPVTLDINQIPIGSTVRPYSAQFPDLATINQIESVGNGYYNGLIASLRTVAYHGVNVKLNYTYGHSRDDLSTTRGAIPQNSYDLRGDYGNSDFDIRHTFTAYIGYNLPDPSRFKLLLGGWQVNSLLSFSTGQPFTVFAGQDISGTNENKDRAQVVGDPFQNVPASSQPNYVSWFNPGAFTQPADGTYSNQARNTFAGPPIEDVDFSVFKNTKIGERFTVQLRGEIFNIFNSRILAPPNTTFTSSNLGRITSTLDVNNGANGIGVGAARNLQLAVKLIF